MELCKVIAYCGTVEHEIMTGSFAECATFCQDSNWEFDYNGGLVWELYIDKDEEHYFEPNYTEESDHEY